MPTREAWRFTDLPPERDYLESNPTFDDIARRIVLNPSVRFVILDDGDKPQVQGCKRAVFRIVEVMQETCDLFFNGRDGYRARYWHSVEDGERANRDLVDRLTPQLMTKLPAEHTGERWRVCMSLASTWAKVWIGEKPDPYDPVRIVAPAHWKKPVPAPRARTLEIKGAWIDDIGGVHVTPDKVDRSKQIHCTGWT